MEKKYGNYHFGGNREVKKETLYQGMLVMIQTILNKKIMF